MRGVKHILLPILLLLLGESFAQKYGDPIREIFRNYRSQIPPFNEDGSPIIVSMGLTPICLDLTEEGDLEGTLWYSWNWMDKRLTWKEESVPQIVIPKQHIYVPDIIPINNNFRERFDSNERAEVYRNGSVFLHQRVRVKGPCSNYDWNNPWNTNECTLSFTPWTHTGTTMKLQHMGGLSDLEKYQEGCPAQVLKVQAHTWNQYHLDMEHPYVFYDFNIVLKRNWIARTRGKDIRTTP